MNDTTNSQTEFTHIGQVISAALKAAGRTKTDLTNATGVSRAYISHITTARITPSRENLIKHRIAEHLKNLCGAVVWDRYKDKYNQAFHQIKRKSQINLAPITDDSTIGTIIGAALNAADRTKTDLASAAGLKQSHISQITTNKIRPSKKNLIKHRIAEHLENLCGAVIWDQYKDKYNQAFHQIKRKSRTNSATITDDSPIGTIIGAALNVAGRKGGDLASAAGLNQRYISQITTARITPSRENLIKHGIAEHLEKLCGAVVWDRYKDRFNKAYESLPETMNDAKNRTRLTHWREAVAKLAKRTMDDEAQERWEKILQADSQTDISVFQAALTEITHKHSCSPEDRKEIASLARRANNMITRQQPT